MKNLRIKIISIFIISFIFIVSIPLISNAAGSFSATISKTTLTVGDTFTVKVTANSAAGTYSVKANNSNVSIISSGTGFLDSNSETWTFKVLKAGNVTITASSIDMTDANNDAIAVSGSKTFNVTLKAKSSGSDTGTTTKPTTPTTTAPKFTSVNQTMYTTGEVNIRKSYSTSSAIIKTVEKGTKVTRTGIGDNGWSKVTYNGQIAYISSSLLTTTKPAEDKPKTEEPKNTTSNEEKNNTTTNENTQTTNNEVDNNNTIDNTITSTNEELGLASLEISGVNFSDGFDPSKHTYGLKLNFFVKNLDITAKANKEDAKIEIIGNQDFVEGENNVTILLTSADGNETATYQIKVTVPSEVATAPQNNIQFYIMCGSIILAAIVLIAIATAIYRKVSNKSSDSKEESDTLFENPYVDDKPKKEKSKGKHSN